MNVEDLKILIVDDHMIMRTLVEKNAESIGLTLIENANNGKQAIEKIKSEDVDIVLADWNMPEMSGLELLKTIRSDKNYDNIAFIMITAESENAMMMEAISSGATAYLTKPFSANDFKEMIEKVLAWLEKKKS